MKYWRGYLIAFIIAVLSWALLQFAAAHSALIDMVYPYMTRIFLTSLTEWTAGLDFCLWQLMIVVFCVFTLAILVLMVVLRWNPIQVFGWLLVPIALVSFLDTALYGMNHCVTIADDVRLEVAETSPESIEEAALYYLNFANDLSAKATRNAKGELDFADFEDLAQQAGDGFYSLTYESHFPVFAGSRAPVKELGWADSYTEDGVIGITVAITGESAVNPQVPDIGLPFAMCHEMAHRMTIAPDPDANFAAFLACAANSDVDFQYSGYLMAVRYCCNTLAATDKSEYRAALLRIEQKMSSKVKSDIADYEEFLGDQGMAPDNGTTDLLVSWHLETVVIPQQKAEEEANSAFDPYDETDERLWDVVNPTTPTVAPTTAE